MILQYFVSGFMVKRMFIKNSPEARTRKYYFMAVRGEQVDK
jgi:hypothetical protein